MNNKETLHEVAEMLDTLAKEVVSYRDAFTGDWVPVISEVAHNG